MASEFAHDGCRTSNLSIAPELKRTRGCQAALFEPTAFVAITDRTREGIRSGPANDRPRSETGGNRSSRSSISPSAQAGSHASTTSRSRRSPAHRRTASLAESATPVNSVTDDVSTHSRFEHTQPGNFFEFDPIPSLSPTVFRPINSQEDPFAFDPFYASRSSQHGTSPPPSSTVQPPTIVVQPATPCISHADLQSSHRPHRRSHSETTKSSPSSVLLDPHYPFIPRLRSASAPRFHHQVHASTGVATTSPGMPLQQPLPAAENQRPAPGISCIPQHVDLFRQEGAADQGLEANRQALRGMEQAGRQREEERATLREKITTLLDEKSVLKNQKTDSQAWKLAVKRVDDRLSTVRRTLKRFDERWSDANAQLLEYRRKYGEPDQY